MKRINHQIAAAVLGLMFALPAIASAHAFLDHADPKVGSEAASSPAEVKIWFTQAIEPKFSKIQVFDADGKQVDKKDSHQDAADKSVLVVSLSTVPAGTYKVVWKVLSVDTHKTQGDFKFVVK